MLKTIIALLAVFTGTPLKRSNVPIKGGTIASYQNDQIQVRETQARNGNPAGVRVSVQGDHLRELATTDGGFAKLRYHLDLKDALEAGLPTGMVVSYNDAPGKSGSGYPVIYVNKAGASESAGTDTQSLVAEALTAGVDRDDVLKALRDGNFDGLRGLIALASSVETVDPEADPDVDGDAFPG